MGKSKPISLQPSTQLVKLDRPNFHTESEAARLLDLYLNEKRANKRLLLMIGRAIESGSLDELRGFADSPITQLYKAS